MLYVPYILAQVPVHLSTALICFMKSEKTFTLLNENGQETVTNGPKFLFPWLAGMWAGYSKFRIGRAGSSTISSSSFTIGWLSNCSPPSEWAHCILCCLSCLDHSFNLSAWPARIWVSNIFHEGRRAEYFLQGWGEFFSTWQDDYIVRIYIKHM